MTTIKNYVFLLMSIGILLIASCKKKEAATKAPTLTTSVVTNITAKGATSGGTISDNGGDAITASGICWSKTNNMPTISNDTTMGTTTSGSFVSQLKNLDPSATYYVRAYATNGVGTGYGDVVTFGTGNGVPEARAVKITGTLQVGSVLTANYTYFDAESNPESGTAFQWYVANDTIGAAVTSISGATAKAYTLATEQSKFIRVGIVPKSIAGASPGTEVKSTWVGPIGAETVTFTYNGQQVTYGVLVSSKTGRKWLDRNLGAKRVATAFDDFQAYGDLFQWGRKADGHQLINWSGPTRTDGIPINPGTTNVLSNTDAPAHSIFITNSTGSLDWRNPKNDNLWQGMNGINSPCPAGWRVPTEAEFDAEIVNNGYVDMGELKITGPGMRDVTSGGIRLSGEFGYYCSSTPAYTDFLAVFVFRKLIPPSSTGVAKKDGSYRGNGYACRCIKN